MPTTNWNRPSHNAEVGGTNLLKSLLGEKRFDYPKSLFAVEDILRCFVASKPNAVILDFFAGSGTTAHAVARLNKQDGGCRQSISVTNNEVSAEEAVALRANGLLPGDPRWEERGVFEHVTRPRITAAITGQTLAGGPLRGDYEFDDRFPMAEGFAENIEFLELKYLDIEEVELDLAFEAVAPLLWLRAGSVGPVIGQRHDDLGEPKAFDIADCYAVLFDPDYWRIFINNLLESTRTVFVVTDSPSVFASVAAELPTGVNVVRLYQNYVTTFDISGDQ